MFDQKRRYYFDYNATSPLSPKVAGWLEEASPLFANPSSVHTSGKRVKKEISRTRNFLFQTFHLPEEKFALFFHSGASEGINTLFKGRAAFLKEKGEKMHLFYLATDHSCVHNLTEDLAREGHSITQVKVDEKGDFCDQKLRAAISQARGEVWANYTWVHNETGVVHSLERIAKIKEATNCRVHVDAVQAVGKIEEWRNLNPKLDAYTFSGHKFGGLKGSGYSFYPAELVFCPSIRGGGQQGGLRSGTENTWGIISTSKALEDMIENYHFGEQNKGRDYIESKLLSLMGDQGEIVGLEHPSRNGNTICFILYRTKAQTTAMALDIAGFDVSSGSACRSGSSRPSRILLAMGRSEEQAQSAIRLSFSPFFREAEARSVWPLLQKVLSPLI